MSFFDFDYVSDPPNDELVDPTSQLNANWYEADNKLHQLQSIPSNLPNTVPIGTEAYYPSEPTDPVQSSRIAAWTGTNWIRGINRTTSTSVWQSIELDPTYVPRTGFPIVGQVNVFERWVAIQGIVQIGSTGTAWPNSTVEVTSLEAIDVSLNPVNGGSSYHQCTANPITTAGGFTAAVVWAEAVTGTNARVAIKVKYQGTQTGTTNNYVVLDGLRWWY